MWTPNIMGKGTLTHGKVDHLLCIQAIEVCLISSISKAVTLVESSAPPFHKEQEQVQ